MKVGEDFFFFGVGEDFYLHLFEDFYLHLFIYLSVSPCTHVLRKLRERTALVLPLTVWVPGNHLGFQVLQQVPLPTGPSCQL